VAAAGVGLIFPLSDISGDNLAELPGQTKRITQGAPDASSSLPNQGKNTAKYTHSSLQEDLS
jgi:hypothetical protein